eukprot:scaffold78917_cov33-Tisochrysis_lutea.AAC.10
MHRILAVVGVRMLSTKSVTLPWHRWNDAEDHDKPSKTAATNAGGEERDVAPPQVPAKLAARASTLLKSPQLHCICGNTPRLAAKHTEHGTRQLSSTTSQVR